MDNILFYTGLTVSVAASVALLCFSIKQSRTKAQIKHFPLRYEEWQARYRARRWYYLIAQIAGIIIAIAGLNI